MPQAPYIPTQDGLLASWSDNFNTLISASPGTYGLLSSDATAIDSAVAPFLTAYAIAINPSTRTKPSVADKDALKSSMLEVVRPYAITIKNNSGVANTDKLDLGLNVSSDSRTPINCPQTQPLVAIIGATPGTHTLRFADSNTPDKRSKPFGAIQIQVWRVIGTTPATSPASAAFYGVVTKQPFGVAFDTADSGKICTYFARWVGRRGDFGPWSLPVSMTVAF